MVRIPDVVRRSAGLGRSRMAFGSWRGRVVVAAAVLLVVGVTIASASKGVLTSFGTEGSGDGQFETPRGVAVNESGAGGVSAGDVYVVDEGNGRVQRFDADGTYLGQFGSPGTGAGELSEPQGVEVDQATGDVYVSEGTGLRVSKFDAAGNFLLMFGRDVDSGGGTGTEVCTTPGTCQSGTAGEAGGEFADAGTRPGHLAVAPAGAPNAGNVLVADPGNRRVQEFTSGGVFVRTFGWDVDSPDGDDAFEICTTAASCLAGDPGLNVGQFDSATPTRVAEDSTGAIYTSEFARVQKFEPQAGPPDLNPLGAFAPGTLTPANGSLEITDIKIGTADSLLAVMGVQEGFSTCPDDSSSPRETPIFEIDSAGVLQDMHITCSGIDDIRGLGVNVSGGLMYASTTTPGHQVWILDDITPPAVVALAPSAVGVRSATFEGTVNPQGTDPGDATKYRFEYSDDGGSTWIALLWHDLGTGVAPVPVSAEKDGLQPNKSYQYRVRAVKAFGNLGATSTPASFTTDPAPPTVDGASTTATANAAILRARVNPNNQATTYHFDYGLTDSYGSTAPIPDAAAGSGGTAVIVAQPIDGLQQNATYHYRVVATNATGTTTGGDRTFTAGLIGGRRYELVSPADKEGSDVVTDGGRVRASTDGNSILYHSLRAFGDVSGTGVSTEFLGEREAGGWKTHSLTPLHTPRTIDDAINLFDPRYVGELSDDLSTGVYVSATPLTEGAPNVAGVKNLYLRRNLHTSGPGIYELLSDANALVTEPSGYEPAFADASDDFSHVVFTSKLNLTADAPPQGFFCVLFGFGCEERAYEHTAAGVRLVGLIPVLPATSCTGGDCVPAVHSAAGQAFNSGNYGYGAISGDGSRIVFTVSVSSGSLVGAIYVREGDTTFQVNASELAVPASPKNAHFEAASADGSKLFFTTIEPLVEDDGDGDLDAYRYDLDAPEGSRLTLLSADEEPGDPAGSVEGIEGVSDDGGRVYFSAGSQLISGARLVHPDESLVFSWHDGELGFVGSVLNRDRKANESTSFSLQNRLARATPDGRFLLFVSSSPDQPTGEQSDDCDGVPCRRAYVYSADANGGDGALACVSCSPDGGPATSDVIYVPRIGVGGAQTESHLNQAITDDGRRVFFSTGDALVPEDHNGAYDVYEYDVRSGQVHLISNGAGVDSYFVDASANGDDVFFTTRARLVGSDFDDNRDLYDARIGGGFPEPPPSAVPCGNGETCKGAASGGPRGEVPGSTRLEAPDGPVLDVPPVFFHVQSWSGRQLRRLASGLPVAAMTTVSDAGALSARLRARFGGRLRLVDAVSKRAAHAGTVRLRVRLSERSMRVLRRDGRLRLVLAVRYGPASEVQRQSVTLVSQGGGR